MERREFEEGFKKAFENAEVQPGDGVWNNVEIDLIRTEGENMKKRVFFYQMLAAASVTFALMVAGAGLYVLNDRSIDHIALQGSQVENARGTSKNNAPASDQTELTDENANSGVKTGEDLSGRNKKEEGVTQTDLADKNRIAASDSDREQKLTHGTDRTRPKRVIDNNSIDAPTEERSGFALTYDEVESNEQIASWSRADRDMAGENLRADNQLDGMQLVDESESEAVTTALVGSKRLPALYEHNIRIPEFRNATEESVADPVALMFQRPEGVGGSNGL